MTRLAPVLLLVAVAVAGCGGSHSSAPHGSASSVGAWSPAVCARQSTAVADELSRFLRAYRPGLGIGSIADVAYFGVRTSLGGFRRHHCSTTVLGHALERSFTRRQRRRLLSLLPRNVAEYLRGTIPATTSSR